MFQNLVKSLDLIMNFIWNVKRFSKFDRNIMVNYWMQIKRRKKSMQQKEELMPNTEYQATSESNITVDLIGGMFLVFGFFFHHLCVHCTIFALNGFERKDGKKKINYNMVRFSWANATACWTSFVSNDSNLYTIWMRLITFVCSNTHTHTVSL